MPRIRVGVRVRPPPDSQSSPSSSIPGLEIASSPSSSTVIINASGLKHEFTFDTIFQPYNSQTDVFEVAAVPIVKAATEGYNGCIFAFGQTGSGKTHTMTGPPGHDSMSMSDQRGFLARTIQLIFQQMKLTENLSLRVSVLEIYNEQLTDLLRESSSTEHITGTSSFATASTSTSTNKLNIVETATGIQVPSLFIVPVVSEDAAYSVFYEALSNRVMAEHNLNRRSSRSHVIYSFYITATRDFNPSSPTRKKTQNVSSTNITSSSQDVVESKLHLVDLAGSERVEKTGSVGGIQKEANHINKSLSFLEHVVLALTKNKKSERVHIPYRSSKLTYLLKDSLGGNCNTYLIACVWPHIDHTWETISTLRFAARIKFIENTPIRNSLMPKTEGGSSHRNTQQLETLRRELILRDMLVQEYSGISNSNNSNNNYQGGIGSAIIPSENSWLPDLTKNQKQRTARSVMKFVNQHNYRNDNDHNNDHNNSEFYSTGGKEINMEHFELHSLSQFKLFASLMRDGIWRACSQDEGIVHGIMKEVMQQYNIHMNGGADLSNVVNINNNNNGMLLSPVVEESEGRGFKFPDMHSPEGHHSNQADDDVIPQHVDREMSKKPFSQDKYHEHHHRHHYTMTDMGNENIVSNVYDDDGNDNNNDGRNHHNSGAQDGGIEGAAVMENFEEFKAGKGSELNRNYEEAKRTAKEAKLRYRHVISLVNGQKSKIDEIQDIINNDNNNNNNEGTEGTNISDEESLIALEQAKKSYREIFEEMHLCKEQVKEMQTLKQKTMTALVNSFQQYQATFAAGTTHI